MLKINKQYSYAPAGGMWHYRLVVRPPVRSIYHGSHGP